MKKKEENEKTSLDISNLSDKSPCKINNQKDLDEKEELLTNKKKETIEDKKIKKYNFKCDKIGYTYILIKDKNNNPLITIGPHWIMFLILFSFITGGFLFLFIFYWKVLNTFLFILGIIVYFIFSYVYIYILITDPGIPKKINDNIVNKSKCKYLYCNICKNWVTIESKTKHCFQCNICIEGQDHHCSWTSKCIGKNNLYYFYFLIFWIIILMLYYIFTFLISHDKWLQYRKKIILELRRKNRK